MSESTSLIESVLSEGFALAGTVNLEGANASFAKHLAAYDSWLAKGREASMEYMRRGRDRRADPRLVFPQAKSILCALMPYSAAPLRGRKGLEPAPQFARYLRGTGDGRDYHDSLKEKMEHALVRFRDAQPESTRATLSWKVCVDTSAVLERTWSHLAGLGWIGKNNMLIHHKIGSYTLIATALLSWKPVAQPETAPQDFCGNCRACLDACPTNALVKPRELDARECISYWTLERKVPPSSANGGDEAAKATAQSRAMGAWIAGCDLCQEVCPFNTKATRLAQAEPPPSHPLEALTLADLAREQPEILGHIKPANFQWNVAALRGASG